MFEFMGYKYKISAKHHLTNKQLATNTLKMSALASTRHIFIFV